MRTGYYGPEVEYEKPKVPHKFSKLEYNNTIQEMLNKIEDVSQIALPLASLLKANMLKICKENIIEALKYYFNNETYRLNSHFSKKYIKNLKLLWDFVIYYKTRLTQEQIKLVRTNIKSLKEDFLQQRAYIEELQTEMEDVDPQKVDVRARYIKKYKQSLKK